MIKEDLHVHTVFCDGKNTPEEVVKSAIEKNMTTLGFSVHSYLFFDESYCIKKGNYENFRSEILFLREKYKDRINILCGVELDFYGDLPEIEFDYIIGSMHYIKIGNEYFPIDESEEKFTQIAKEHFSGDFYSLAEYYYKNISQVVEKTNADIIGHIDLVTKFNENNKLFDVSNERYVKASRDALDKLLKFNRPFEINTGAISRGHRTEPYPDKALLEYIYKKGGRVILSSDSHSKDTLCYQFDKWKKLLDKNYTVDCKKIGLI